MRIAIDAGHGLHTAGKQTLKFNGSFMHEHEFNRAAAFYLADKLKNHETIFAHWTYGDLDRSLSERCMMANNFNADIFVSIHANAAPGTDWDEANGIETYYYMNSIKGKKLAKEVQNALIDKTGRNDRGILPKSYYVLKYTKMPAILIKCGFMTNIEEAKLMISDKYRRMIACAVKEGIYNYFGINEDNYMQLPAEENKAKYKESRMMHISWEIPVKERI